MNLEEKINLSKNHIQQFKTDGKIYNQHYVGVLVCNDNIYKSIVTSLNTILLALDENLTSEQRTMLSGTNAKKILDKKFITAKSLEVLNESLCDSLSDDPLTWPTALPFCVVGSYEEKKKDTYKLLIAFYLVQEKIKKYFTYVYITSKGEYYYDSAGDVNLPTTLCTKVCIVNTFEFGTKTGDKGNPISNNNPNFMNEARLKDHIFTECPQLLDDYLKSINISVSKNRIYDRSYFNSYHNNEYCCTNSTIETPFITNSSNNCYTDEVKNNQNGCYPNVIQENFSTNILEGMEQKPYNFLEIQNQNSQYTSGNEYSNEQNSKLMNEYDSTYSSYLELQKKSKNTINNNQLFEQMIKDNILITKRYEIIRYLIIVILIFSILKLFKYINII